MKFTMTLPKDFISCDILTLLEERWLVPKKVRHFLRTKKNILVNDESKKFHEIVHAGDHITLTFEESDYPETTVLLGDQSLVQTVFEDEHIIVVEKPVRMKTHPNDPGENDTMLNHVADYLAKDSLTPYVVHRLDKETSGLLMFAKNPFILPILGRMLEKKQINRSYQAIVKGKIKQDDLIITKRIGRDRQDKRLRVIDEKGGQQAQTFVHVIKKNQQLSFLECSLSTGRTHQIRVHLQSIGHPIIGDPLYYPQSAFERLLLHAFQLSFTHPLTEKQIVCTSDLSLDTFYR